MRRILIFCLAYYPNDVSGAEVAIKEITDRIKSEEIEFHMISLRYDSHLPKVEKIGNVLVHRIGITKRSPKSEDIRKLPLDLNKPLFQFLAAWKALQLHKKYQYDAVWSMMAHSAGVPAAIFKMFYPGVPYILTLQEGDPPRYIERVMKPVWPLFKRAFTSATIVQVISGFLGEWARHMGFKGTLEVIYNGANSRDFSEVFSPDELELFKQKVGKKPGDIYLVTTSRLVHKNATDDVIRAMPLLPHHVSFVVVGGGEDEHMLKELARDLRVEDRVKFVGQVDRTETPKYRRISDIFVRPSRSEGFGNSFASAMAGNLPVIATQEGGIAEFLFDEKRNPDKPTTGWAVDKDNPQQIAEAVMDIINNKEKVQRVTETARQMTFEKYNWDSIAKDMQKRVFQKAFETVAK